VEQVGVPGSERVLVGSKVYQELFAKILEYFQALLSRGRPIKLVWINVSDAVDSGSG
jgi:hypothetical protein